MGSGIAEVAARTGCDVVVCEVDEAAPRAGRDGSAVARARGEVGQATAADREAAEGRVRTVTDIAELADRDLVVEAVVEDEAEKLAVFQALGKVARPDALLASNTSSIPIMKLAAVTPQPQRVIGMHFFNPVPVLPLVELVPSLLTSPETVRPGRGVRVGRLGKHIMRCKDRAGFIVNALLVPYLLAAIRMLESGFACADDIDTGMVEGCAHPMGPLALADLIGLDTIQAVADSMYAEFKEPLYAPPPLLLRMVEAGLLGRKTGRGFFDYAQHDHDRRSACAARGYTETAPVRMNRGLPGRGGTRAADGAAGLELLAQGAEDDLGGGADEVGVRGGQGGGPLRPGALGRLLLEVEHVLQDGLVAFQPGEAVLAGLVGDLLPQLADALGGGLDLRAHIGGAHGMLSLRLLLCSVLKISNCAETVQRSSAVSRPVFHRPLRPGRHARKNTCRA